MDNQPIDHKFKEFFEQRTLAPKENAWDRMESLMPASEVPSVVKKMPLYWVAAATFAGFMIALFMFNQSSTIATQEIITKAEVSSEVKASNEALPQATIIPSEVKSETKEIADVLPRKHFSAPKNTSISHVEHQVSEIQLTSEPKLSTIEKITDQVVVSSVNKQENKSESLYNTKIDADLLLKDVDQKLKVKKKISSEVASFSFKPDPSKLLEEAEKANEKSTLQKIFKSLQNNSESVIAVVSNRNYQK
jgi:hypothetical protein